MVRSRPKRFDPIGRKFPKHVYHSIICTGALVAEQVPQGWKINVIAAPHAGQRSEPELISAFVNRIAELCPQLVTFNGSSFDLPVLRHRAMIRKIAALGLAARNYSNRYTDDAFDLCDALACFSPSGKITLNELSRMMGLPGKTGDIQGPEVERFYL